MQPEDMIRIREDQKQLERQVKLEERQNELLKELSKLIDTKLKTPSPSTNNMLSVLIQHVKSY